MRHSRNSPLAPDDAWLRLFKSMIVDGTMREMGPAAFMTYVVIKSHANLVTGLSFPEQKTIAEYTGYGVSTIKRAIAKLEEMGRLENVALDTNCGEQVYLTDKKDRKRRKRKSRKNKYKIIEHLQTNSGIPISVDYIPKQIQAWLNGLETQLREKINDASLDAGANNITVNINIEGDVLVGLSHEPYENE